MKRVKFLSVFILTMVFLILPVSNVSAKEKINVYIFRGEGCPHCEEALKFFDSIEEEYGQYYSLKQYEVWNDQDNATLMNKVASELNEEASGVPYIVIGKKTFSGYATSYDDQIKSAIKNAYDSDSYKDVVKSVQSNTSTTEKNDSPIVAIVIVAGIAVILIAGLVVLTKKM